MAKIRSQYQRDAIVLRRDVLKAAGRSDLDVDTFDEAVALADAAMAASQWDSARDAYRKALDIARETEAQRSGRHQGGARGPGPRRIILPATCSAREAERVHRDGRRIVFEDPQKKIVRKDSAAAARRRRWRWRRR